MTALNEWSGFKHVGDNIDKTIKPRDMQLNNEPTSLHYFNVCAVKKIELILVISVAMPLSLILKTYNTMYFILLQKMIVGYCLTLRHL